MIAYVLTCCATTEANVIKELNCSGLKLEGSLAEFWVRVSHKTAMKIQAGVLCSVSMIVATVVAITRANVQFMGLLG